MVGETGQLHVLCGTVCPFCKYNSQNLAGSYCIISKCLVEITHPKKQQGIGMLCLNLKILLHQRSLNYLLFLGHILFFGN